MSGRSTCRVEECDRESYCALLCTTHYQRWRKHGSTEKPERGLEPIESVLRSFEVDGSGCWVWSRARNRGGYGIIWRGNRAYLMAHRVSYESRHGAIRAGLVLDHLCRNRACINPDHLEPVTNAENILRGVGVTARNAGKPSCVHGHPFDDANTYYRPDGDRSCRECRRRVDRRRRAIARNGAPS